MELNKEQKIYIYSMILDGKTAPEISQELKIPERVIYNITTAGFEMKGAKKCIYPRIRAFMREKGISVHRFSQIMGVNGPTLYNALSGMTYPKKNLIDKILEATGMSYEKAFSMEEE